MDGALTWNYISRSAILEVEEEPRALAWFRARSYLTCKKMIEKGTAPRRNLPRAVVVDRAIFGSYDTVPLSEWH